MNATWAASIRRQPLLRGLAAMLAALLASLGLVAAGGAQASAASAASSCSASYVTVAQWAGGFEANVTITNTGTSTISGWTVTFTFGGDQVLTALWGASVSQSIESVAATNAGYDGSVAVGGSTFFGFYGTWKTSDAPPASLTCTPVI